MATLIRQKVIDTALGEVGYQGSTYDSKYSRALDAVSFYNYKKSGACTWCKIFCDWCVYINMESDNQVHDARQALCEPDRDNCGAGCVQAANYFKSKGQWYSRPSDAHKGDIIFFKNSSGIYHAGLVVDWDSSKIYTVEGSTGGAKVLKRSYSYSDSKIAGFGRPSYTANDVEPEPEPTPEPTPAPQPEPTPEPTDVYMVKTESGDPLRLRAEPNTSSAQIGLLSYGAVIKSVKVVEGQTIDGCSAWVYDGTGYASGRYLMPTPVVPTPAPVKATYQVKTNGGTLSLRAKPEVSATKLADIPNGTKLEVTEIVTGEVCNNDTDWAHTTYDGKDGYCTCSWLVKVDEPAYTEYYVKTKSEVGLKIREKPTTESNMIGFIPEGEKCKVFSIDSNYWASVEYSGIRGYSSARYLRKA